MKTSFNDNNFNLYNTHKENWKNFEIINDHRDLSEFQAWSMHMAFALLFPKLRNNYVWSNACIESYDNDVDETVGLYLTKEGNLILMVYEKDSAEQIEQYVVQPLLSALEFV